MRDRPLIEVAPHRPMVRVLPATTVLTACARMRDEQVSAVVVTDHEGHLLGIFTGRDAVRLLAEGLDAKSTRVDAVMTKNPTTLGPSARAMDALLLMSDCGFRHIPIVDGARVAGIVSRYDFRAKEQARMDDESGFMEVMR